MTTIMMLKNEDGKIIGRCDARCYNAKNKKCKCICEGYNHGKGINEAIKFTISNIKFYQDMHHSPNKLYIKQGQLQLL